MEQLELQKEVLADLDLLEATKMSYYQFTQNNSGGEYKGPFIVIIEANDVEDADYFAIKKTNECVYFGGVSKGLDCGCCGNRWDRASDYSKLEAIDLESIETEIRDQYSDKYWRGKEIEVYTKDAKTPFKFIL